MTAIKPVPTIKELDEAAQIIVDHLKHMDALNKQERNYVLAKAGAINSDIPGDPMMEMLLNMAVKLVHESRN